MLSLNYRCAVGIASAVILAIAGCSPGDSDSAGDNAGSATEGDTTDDGSGGPTPGSTGDPTSNDADTGTSTYETDTEEGSSGTEAGSTTGPPVLDTCEATKEDPWPQALVSHKVTLDVRVNGEAHEGSVYDDADIYLVNTESGDRAYFGRLSAGTLSGWVLPGEYRVSYEARSGAYSIPRNRRTIVGDPLWVAGSSDEPVVVDVVSLDVELDLTFNGQAPMATPAKDSNKNTAISARPPLGASTEPIAG